jgi:hypothetical protein
MNQKATVPNYGKLWYNPKAVTNIFSLSEMEKKHRITYDSTKEKAFTVHRLNKEVKFIKSSNRLYYHKPRNDTNKNKGKTPVNHTIIPITASVKSFSHVMIAGVDDNVRFAGVARNTTVNNDINQNEMAEISKDELYQTLVEFIDISTKAEKPEENDNDNIENGLQNKVVRAKNAEIKENYKFKENTEEKDNKEDKDKELNIKYCPTNATLADLLTKPLAKANIHKIRKTIKCIIGQQEGVGEKHKNGTSSNTGTGTAVGSSSGCWSKLLLK